MSCEDIQFDSNEAVTTDFSPQRYIQHSVRFHLTSLWQP